MLLFFVPLSCSTVIFGRFVAAPANPHWRPDYPSWRRTMHLHNVASQSIFLFWWSSFRAWVKPNHYSSSWTLGSAIWSTPNGPVKTRSIPTRTEGVPTRYMLYRKSRNRHLPLNRQSPLTLRSERNYPQIERMNDFRDPMTLWPRISSMQILMQCVEDHKIY